MSQVARQHSSYKYTILFVNILFVDIFITCFVYMRADTGSKKTYHILRWKIGGNNPLRVLGTGSSKFIELKCPYQNCHVTDDRKYFPNVSDFDALVFCGRQAIKFPRSDLPQERSPSQKYIFAMTEPAPMFMSCNDLLEDLFNWTWTYKLSSDIRFSYIVIYDLNGREVGPKANMNWPMEMKPIQDETTKAILDGKSKAATWIVSRCATLSKREIFVEKMRPELSKLNLTLDVYGRCGDLGPVEDGVSKELIKRDYYFYLSFENSLAWDYVSEKLLTALLNYAVPVVYGGADYTRFLPPGSYLDAHKFSPMELARTMKEIIENRTRYYDFFRWRNHFVYKYGDKTSEICNVCAALNKNTPNNLNLRHGFRHWWAGEYKYRFKRCSKKYILP
ncbi:alpha-(1,3)-fucosyltransferase C-like [Plodia interpunctella]|uniref:alpha-(1,3)-fucosyltransferase C-like n=1 Tax=Plodia interpunctella TaxID=58824 RepID=UPI002367BBA2|nr:alpha-(1,3)-fucosyltransferase C-like isoform X2 [Plodia interpunctella]